MSALAGRRHAGCQFPVSEGRGNRHLLIGLFASSRCGEVGGQVEKGLKVEKATSSVSLVALQIFHGAPAAQRRLL